MLILLLKDPWSKDGNSNVAMTINQLPSQQGQVPLVPGNRTSTTVSVVPATKPSNDYEMMIRSNSESDNNTVVLVNWHIYFSRIVFEWPAEIVQF